MTSSWNVTGPSQSIPSQRQRALDLLDRLRDLAARVGVLDPQQALAAPLPGEQPVEQERPHAADVEESCRADGAMRTDGDAIVRLSYRVVFGAHVSAAGGIHTTLDRAEAMRRRRGAALHAEPAHVAADEPRSGELRALQGAASGSGHRARRRARHAIYLVNLAAPDNEIHSKSRTALRNTMEVACAIEADGVVFHVGSHLGDGHRKPG